MTLLSQLYQVINCAAYGHTWEKMRKVDWLTAPPGTTRLLPTIVVIAREYGTVVYSKVCVRCRRAA